MLKKKREETRQLSRTDEQKNDPSAVQQGLIRNELGGNMAIKNSFIRNWNRQKKLRFAKFQKKAALKISDNKSDGVTSPNVFA